MHFSWLIIFQVRHLEVFNEYFKLDGLILFLSQRKNKEVG